LGKILKRFYQSDDLLLYNRANNLSLQETESLSLNDKNLIKRNFFLTLTLCHDVMIVKTPKGDEFHGQSTDEITLIDMMSKAGFKMTKRSNNSIFITDPEGLEQEYRIIEIFEFTSDRRKMSVVVRLPETNNLMLFSKGAD
jgi:magnesium-transporting ATPase (P-type)